MITPPMPTSTCERLAALYWRHTARLAVLVTLPPRTVTSSVDVPATCVMVARKRALVLLSSVIQPVAEGMLMALLTTETVLPAMLAVPLRDEPRTVAALFSRFRGVVP